MGRETASTKLINLHSFPFTICIHSVKDNTIYNRMSIGIANWTSSSINITCTCFSSFLRYIIGIRFLCIFSNCSLLPCIFTNDLSLDRNRSTFIVFCGVLGSCEIPLAAEDTFVIFHKTHLSRPLEPVPDTAPN